MTRVVTLALVASGLSLFGASQAFAEVVEPPPSDPAPSEPAVEPSTTEPAVEPSTTEPAVEPSTTSTCSATARPVGPLQAGFLDGQLGVPRRACVRSEVALVGDGGLIAQPENFYGNIRASGRLSGSVVVAPGVELWASVEVLRYQTVLSAVTTSYLGLGYTSLGGTWAFVEGEGRSVATYARLVVPTTTGLDRGAQPLALELGGTASWAAHPNLEVHAWLSALGSVAISGLAPPDPRAGVRVGGGLDWAPFDALSFVLELGSGFGVRDALDLLSAQGGVRLAFGDRVGLELSANVPIAGAEPSLASGLLAVSGRLDGR